PGRARRHQPKGAVAVADDARGDHAPETHRLELEPRDRAVRGGEERLVHGETDLLAGDGLARREVRFDELPGEALFHCNGVREAGAIGGWPETRRDAAPFRMSLLIPLAPGGLLQARFSTETHARRFGPTCSRRGRAARLSAC